MDEDFGSRYFLRQHKNLVMIALMGNMERQLSQIDSIIKHKYPQIELAPVQHQSKPKRNLLAMFMYNPLLDITIDQLDGLGRESVIVGYSFGKEGLIDVVRGITKEIGFIPRDIDDPNSKQWETEFKVERMAYDSYGVISRHLGVSFASLFGSVRYLHFLINYMGMSEREAMKTSSQKFGIPIKV